MPQASLSSTTQSIGNPGPLIFTCASSNPGLPVVSVSFHNALCRMIQPQYAPVQHVNVAANYSIHIFQIASAEQLILPIQFQDLPWDDTPTDPREQTDGYRSLLSFIRTTLNYYVSTFSVTTPDGQIEPLCRYMGGVDSFVEAEGRAQRAQRWTGNLTLWRVITS